MLFVLSHLDMRNVNIVIPDVNVKEVCGYRREKEPTEGEII